MDFLSCEICCSTYTEEQKPVVLTCGHTYCMNCINFILKSSPQENKNCPTCREPISYYNINYAVLSLSQSLIDENYK